MMTIRSGIFLLLLCALMASHFPDGINAQTDNVAASNPIWLNVGIINRIRSLLEWINDVIRSIINTFDVSDPIYALLNTSRDNLTSLRNQLEKLVNTFMPTPGMGNMSNRRP